MKLLEKLKGIKHMELIILLVAAALALVYLAGGSGQGGGQDELARVLSRIEGAGEVEVYISYYDGAEASSIYAFSQAEEKGQVRGVVIVASGADDAAVKLRLAQAARTALGIDASRVSVQTMGKGGK